MNWPLRGSRSDKDDRVFVNDQIRAPYMIIIGDNNEKLGKFSRDKVFEMGHDAGMDIVQLHYDFQEKVATVKLVDFGKYMYEKQKNAKEKRKQQKKPMKQIKFWYSIGDNDLALKVKNIRKFLVEGHPVKIIVRLKWRERIFASRVADKLRSLQVELADVGKSQEWWPKYETNGYVMLLFPKGT